MKTTPVHYAPVGRRHHTSAFGSEGQKVSIKLYLRSFPITLGGMEGKLCMPRPKQAK